MIGIVSQHALRTCRLEFEDRVLDRASLFPLFDVAGRVRLLMVAAEESGRILLARRDEGVFARRWVRRYRLRLWFTELHDASADDRRLEDLWHFDPWWVLGDERYAGHEAVPAIMSTNIAGYDASVSRVWFSSDLAAVTHVILGTGESQSFRRFDARVLAPSVGARPRAPVRPRSGQPAEWRLRPFWQ